MKPSQAAAVALLAALGVSCARQPVPATGQRADVRLRAEIEVIDARVPRSATLDSLLRGHQLPSTLVTTAVRSAARVFDPRQLRAGHPYRLVRSLDGWLRTFEYEIDADRFLRIINKDYSRPEVLHAEVLRFEKDTRVAAIRGRIDAEHPSLVAAMAEAGENIRLAISLAEIFGGQIDFESDLQSGDGFEVLVERSERGGQFAGYGAILGASFTADGKTHRAFRWVHPETRKAAYYDETGRSLKRFFLVSPLKFEPRVTSAFARRRFHPVHHAFRAHLGVDYGAPHGASVVAVASGTVVSAGWAGGGGKQVRIRHAAGFETYYLHLSAYGRGIRAGARVNQGQIVGRVGSTGTATGPHLDFRLRRNGAFVDPVKERRRQPPGEPVPAAYAEAFRAAREAIAAQLSSTLRAEAPRTPADAKKATGSNRVR